MLILYNNKFQICIALFYTVHNNAVHREQFTKQLITMLHPLLLDTTTLHMTVNVRITKLTGT